MDRVVKAQRMARANQRLEAATRQMAEALEVDRALMDKVAVPKRYPAHVRDLYHAEALADLLEQVATSYEEASAVDTSYLTVPEVKSAVEAGRLTVKAALRSELSQDSPRSTLVEWLGSQED